MSPTLTDAENEAVKHLRPEYQRQLDMDGVMVGVSRQALDETLAALDRITTQPQADARERPTSPDKEALAQAIRQSKFHTGEFVPEWDSLSEGDRDAWRAQAEKILVSGVWADDAPAPAAERSDPMPSYLLDEIWETHKDRDPRVNGWVMTIAKYRLSQARDRETIEALRTPASAAEVGSIGDIAEDLAQHLARQFPDNNHVWEWNEVADSATAYVSSVLRTPASAAGDAAEYRKIELLWKEACVARDDYKQQMEAKDALWMGAVARADKAEAALRTPAPVDAEKLAELDGLTPSAREIELNKIINDMVYEKSCLREALAKSAPHICSFCCPNKWERDQKQPHCDLCKEITALLAADIFEVPKP